MSDYLPRAAFVQSYECDEKQPPKAPDYLHYWCSRPAGHGGRHAWIDYVGEVVDVWGEDVHAQVRAKGRA